MVERMKDGGRVWKLICEQENMLLAQVDAIRVSGKPEVIGSLFEEEFRSFLTRLMPASISVVPGFIVEENGRDSSHFDVLLIDNSYPFLGSIGPHRYVMSASVVAAIELTTRLDAKKLKLIIEKGDELRRISGEHYEAGAFGGISFYTVCADCQLSVERIKSEFQKNKPEGVLCALRGAKSSSGFVAWMEDGTNGTAMCLASKSPLADFISMHLQGAFFALSARIRDVSTIGKTMNHYIHWGTAKDNAKLE
jgi:hypothetical protein